MATNKYSGSTNALIKYTNAVKPFHSKLGSIISNLSFSDLVQVSIGQKINTVINLTGIFYYNLNGGWINNIEMSQVVKPGGTTKFKLPTVNFPNVNNYRQEYNVNDIGKTLFYAASDYESKIGEKRVYVSLPTADSYNIRIHIFKTSAAYLMLELVQDVDYFILGETKRIVSFSNTMSTNIIESLTLFDKFIIEADILINDKLSLNASKDGKEYINIPVEYDFDTTISNNGVSGATNTGEYHRNIEYDYADADYSLNSVKLNANFSANTFGTNPYSSSFMTYSATATTNAYIAGDPTTYIMTTKVTYYNMFAVELNSPDTIVKANHNPLAPAMYIDDVITSDRFAYTAMIKVDQGFIKVCFTFISSSLSALSNIRMIVDGDKYNMYIKPSANEPEVLVVNGRSRTSSNIYTNNTASTYETAYNIFYCNAYYYDLDGVTPSTVPNLVFTEINFALQPSYLVADDFSLPTATINATAFSNDSFGREIVPIRDMTLNVDYSNIAKSIEITKFEIIEANIPNEDYLSQFIIKYTGNNAFTVYTKNNNFATFYSDKDYIAEVDNPPFNINITSNPFLELGDMLIWRRYIDYKNVYNGQESYDINQLTFIPKISINEVAFNTVTKDFNFNNLTIHVDSVNVDITNSNNARFGIRISYYQDGAAINSLHNVTSEESIEVLNGSVIIQIAFNPKGTIPLTQDNYFTIYPFIGNTVKQLDATHYSMQFDRLQSNYFEFDYFNCDRYFENSVAYPMHHSDNVVIKVINYQYENFKHYYDLEISVINIGVQIIKKKITYNVPIQVTVKNSKTGLDQNLFVFTLKSSRGEIQYPFILNGLSGNSLPTCTFRTLSRTERQISKPLILMRHKFTQDSASLGLLPNDGYFGKIKRNLSLDTRGEYYEMFISLDSSAKAVNIDATVTRQASSGVINVNCGMNETVDITYVDTGESLLHAEDTYDTYLTDFINKRII